MLPILLFLVLLGITSASANAAFVVIPANLGYKPLVLSRHYLSPNSKEAELLIQVSKDVYGGGCVNEDECEDGVGGESRRDCKDSAGLGTFVVKVWSGITRKQD